MEEKEKEKQKEFISNIESVKIIFTTLKELNKLNEIQNENDLSFGEYIENLHSITIPVNTENLNKDVFSVNFSYSDIIEIITHELIHAAYSIDKELTKKEKRVLIYSFDDKEMVHKDKNRKERLNNDLRIPNERIVRKVKLDFELERLNIKKIGEEFTEKHYDKLKEIILKTKEEKIRKEKIKSKDLDLRIFVGKEYISSDAYQIFVSSSKEGLMKMLNEL